MKPEDFLKEVAKHPDAPKDFEIKYSEFQKFQEAALLTLKEFHRVCEKNSIRYQLAYGSLLGAIRDGGQIPWDYDIDVFVPYNQKKQLVDALKIDLDKQFYFYCPETDPKCRHVIMRVAPVGYRTEVLHVDVFYYIGLPDDIEARNKLIKEIKYVSRARVSRLINIKEEALGSIKRTAYLLARKIPVLLMNPDLLQKKYDILCSKYQLDTSSICTEADGYAGDIIFPKSLFEQTKLIHLDCGDFRIPVRYDEMLKLIYGDYMQVPKLDYRIKEVMHNYKRLTSFSL